MPPRKGYLKRKNVLKKKMVTSRLIQISVRLDDFVYRKKPISPTEANAYLMEIEGLKPQCKGDIHSEQVIEKLTRCMTGIIAEHKNLSTQFNEDNIVDINPEENTCVSPAYSLPDQDRTYIATQREQNVININDDTECPLPVEILVNISNDDIPVETIVISDDEIGNQNQTSVDVEIHRAMSSLSITKIDKQTNEQQSQSILEDYEHGETLKEKPCNQNKEVVHKTNIKTASNNKENKIINKTKKSNVGKNTPLKSKAVRFSAVNTSGKSANKETNKKGTKYNRKSQNSIDTNIAPTERKRKQRKDAGSSRKKKSVENRVLVENEFTDTNTHINDDALAIRPLNTIKTDANKKNLNVNAIKEATIPKIYNKPVELDLTWMENIRYVREITANENDPKLNSLEDSFWDNWDFPDSWNDEDFKY